MENDSLEVKRIERLMKQCGCKLPPRHFEAMSYKSDEEIIRLFTVLRPVGYREGSCVFCLTYTDHAACPRHLNLPIKYDHANVPLFEKQVAEMGYAADIWSKYYCGNVLDTIKFWYRETRLTAYTGNLFELIYFQYGKLKWKNVKIVMDKFVQMGVLCVPDMSDVLSLDAWSGVTPLLYVEIYELME